MSVFGRRILKAKICSKYFAQQLNTRKITGKYDIAIVGGGIVGTATARELSIQYPDLKLVLLEKESRLAVHQTGHNSGVIHAGIYYVPGSQKAKLCVEGLRLSYKYCEEKCIPFKKVGKLIVATNEEEIGRLDTLYERGIKNQVPELSVIEGEEEIKEIEPNCRGLKALHSPHTGIVDWALVCHHYGEDFKCNEGEIRLNFEVVEFCNSCNSEHPVQITSKCGDTILSKYVLTCGGLQSDLLAEMTGCPKDPRIIPFRGEYLMLTPEKSDMVCGNIYPVPDPRYPFLGVHFTPRMNGDIWLGPNAILSFAREGYKWSDINLAEMFDALKYPGFLKLALKNIPFGLSQVYKSVFMASQVKDLQRFIPDLKLADVKRGPAGVRAQALDKQGNLVDDFYFDSGKSSLAQRVLHCRNAPSPGATSSMAIAKMMVEKVAEEFTDLNLIKINKC